MTIDSGRPNQPGGTLQDPALSAQHITVLRGQRRVLDALDLSLLPGQVVSVQGPSGAGKSTLLAALCGLIAVESGEIYVDSERTDSLSGRRRSHVRLRRFGLVFQGDELLPELSLLENITLPMRLIGRPKRTADYLAEVEPVADALGISDLLDRMPSEVSGGQLQRAAVARAVIHKPRVVLADEPTASLDPVAAADAMHLLIDLARGRRAAVVVVTHDDALGTSCDKRLVLADGRLSDLDGVVANA